MFDRSHKSTRITAMLRGLAALCLPITALIFCSDAVAQRGLLPTPVQVGASDDARPLNAASLVLEDPDARLDLQSLRALEDPERWQPADPAGALGWTASAMWLHTILEAAPGAGGRYVLEVAQPMLAEIDVFQVYPDGRVVHQQGGSSRSIDSRPIDYTIPAFPVALPGQGQVELFVRARQLKANGSQAPLRLSSATNFHTRARLFEPILACYWGFILALALYNLLLFASIRDPAHLYLAVWLLGSAATDGCTKGTIQVWLSSSVDPTRVLATSLPLMAMAMNAFLRSFLALEAQRPRMHRVLGWLVLFEGSLLLVGFFMPSNLVMGIAMGAALPSSVIPIAAAVMGLKLRGRPAQYFFVGFIVFMGGGVMQVLGQFGVIPYSLIAENAQAVGCVLMALLLSLALAARIREERAQREAAQAHALHLQEAAAANLQRQVDERTLELRQRTDDAEQARGEADGARRQAEEAHARLAELDQQKTRFFQNISHELRTPLTLILNPLEGLAGRLPHEQDLQVAVRNARRLLRLVNQLLDFQKISAGKRKLELAPVDMVGFTRVCGDYFASACAHRDVRFDVTLDGKRLSDTSELSSVILVQGELDALEKVTFNYLSNALKYTPDGGHICLDLSTAEGQVRLAISDDGPGIAANQQSTLFDSFSQVDGSATRSHEGSGLGLALVKELTEAMGGEVGVESAPGEGSRFWAALPRLEGSAGSDTALKEHDLKGREWLLPEDGSPPGCEEQDDALAQGDGSLVLVIDDLPDMRHLLADCLREGGYRVAFAQDGQAGLERALELRPELVITDWMMPRMTGPDLIARLRESPLMDATPTILLTARSDAESKVLGTEVGADAYLGKPFNEQELLALVRNLLGLKRNEREVQALNSQLSVSIAELRTLFDGMRQGVFSFDHEGRVGGHWSAAAAEIFDTDKLDERSVEDLLLQGMDEGDLEKDVLARWLQMVFEVPSEDFDEFRTLAPEEIVQRRDDGKLRHLQLELRPITERGSLKQVMCLASDVSEQRRAEAEAESRQQSNQTQIALLRQISDGGAGLVRFLRDGRERWQMLQQAASELQGLPSRAQLDGMFRDAHGLKGDARLFAAGEVEERAHDIEETLQALRSPESHDPVRLVALLNRQCARLGEALDTFEQTLIEVAPVGAAVLDQTTVSQRLLQRALTMVQNRHDELAEVIEGLAARPLGEAVKRLVDAAPTWAEERGRKVVVLSECRDLPVPGKLAGVLRGTLTHLVRNSIVHGIEAPEDRQAAGKAEFGVIQISGERVAGGVRILFQDDGRGLDMEALTARARACGISIQTGHESSLIFEPGLTTADATDALAGRGVGMDAVRSTLQESGYDITVASTPGQSTRFVIRPRQRQDDTRATDTTKATG